MAETKNRAQEEAEHMPSRQCAVTRLQRPKEDLVRFVLAPSGEVVPDLKCKLPGRGVWVTAARDIIEEARKRNIFARAFQQSVNLDAVSAEKVEDLLSREAIQRLSLANKAGGVVAGFAKVMDAIASGDVRYLVHASEAAEDGLNKLNRRFEAVCRDNDRKAISVNCFSSAQLSLALGRPNVIHAAIRNGGAADKFYLAALRLQRYSAGREAYSAA